MQLRMLYTARAHNEHTAGCVVFCSAAYCTVANVTYHTVAYFVYNTFAYVTCSTCLHLCWCVCARVRRRDCHSDPLIIIAVTTAVARVVAAAVTVTAAVTVESAAPTRCQRQDAVLQGRHYALLALAKVYAAV